MRGRSKNWWEDRSHASAACLLAACVALSPGTAWASFNTGQRYGLEAILIAIAVAVVIGFLLDVLFIHIASGLVGMPNRSFGRAFRAAILSVILGLVVWWGGSLLLVMAGVDSLLLRIAAGLAMAILPSTLAIQSSYKATFLASLFTFLASVILAVICWWGVYFGMLVLIGTMGR